MILGWLSLSLALCAEAAHPFNFHAVRSDSGSEVTSAPLATVLNVQADPGDTPSWYRFRYREPGQNWTLLRDYGPVDSLQWTVTDHEGPYEIEVSRRDLASGVIDSAVNAITFTALALGRVPTVNPTIHPLVALLSAPPCADSMRVEFWGPDGIVHSTPSKACTGLSMNFLLAGMYANTQYTAHAITGEKTVGPNVVFTSGDLAYGLYETKAVVTAPPVSSQPILLGTSSSMGSVATDLAGNVLWYALPGLVSFIARPEGGSFWGYFDDINAGADRQIIARFDLTGMKLLETNAARVNETLLAMGKRPITGFHHEVRSIPGGRIVALAGVQQTLTDAQGPGDVEVLGDMIVVFDQNLNPVWTWDTFDFLDTKRIAVLGETCATGGGCAPFKPGTNPNDWTHGNAIQLTPDGNLLYSTRHQDWVIKISYDNGQGDGHIIWRLGKDGDFSFLSDDPFPWFSHQHDANFAASDPSLLLVFDNGNTRISASGQGTSRGQVIRLDEQNRTASFVLNAPLGVYSRAVGSAQLLTNGNYHFDAGFVFAPAGIISNSFEIDPAGRVISNLTTNTVLYRTFRLADLYTIQ